MYAQETTEGVMNIHVIFTQSSVHQQKQSGTDKAAGSRCWSRAKPSGRIQRHTALSKPNVATCRSKTQLSRARASVMRVNERNDFLTVVLSEIVC